MKYDLEYVLDSALDGIFIVGSDHRLVLFNRACQELYGISRDDFVEKAVRKLSDFKAVWNDKALKKKKNITFGDMAVKKERMTLPHKNGKVVWVETIYTPIYDRKNGEIAYVMGVIKDITEQKILEEEKENLLVQLGNLRRNLEKNYNFSHIAGRSANLVQTMKLAGQVAKQNTTVLISGESGTGKELLAKAIHFNSPRAAKPFVPINCSAFPDTLIESELFGYEKGAFTGAEKSKPGKVQLASGGTLFLDEVSELSASAQAKMLRVIQEREFQPLGGVRNVRVDIRIIVATNKDIEKLVAEGKFREDLYYRLYVYPITLPPLRERLEDLPLLIDTFIKKMNREMGRQIRGLTREAINVLRDYHWPGNVRELQNVVERVMILSQKDVIDLVDLPQYLRRKKSIEAPAAEMNGMGSLPEKFSLEQFVQRCENRIIVDTLKTCGFNKTRAARNLGLTRSTFRYKLSKVPGEMLNAVLMVNTEDNSGEAS